MKILDPQTAPPKNATARRHSPTRAKYPSYRNCLRWDFGFTCPFCLLHESDTLAGKLRLSTIEHFETQRKRPDRADDYENCLLACSWCNFARGSRPDIADNGSLLDPTKVAWANHFALTRNSLVPDAYSPDAIYTHWAYNLDDERKVRLRRKRREVLEKHLDLFRLLPAKFERLVSTRKQQVREHRFEYAKVMLEAEQTLVDLVKSLVMDLLLFRAIPASYPRRCRCTSGGRVGAGGFSLPAELDKNTVDLHELILDLPGPLRAAAVASLERATSWAAWSS